jgi:GntR family transcriptional regulator/MocR family aminotransferase
MHGLDVNSRVIYIGTFSKVLFPSLRIGYVVIPRDLVDMFVTVRHAMDVSPPYLYQEVLTEFINAGHFARHLRKMRQIYSQRRAALIENLSDEFPADWGLKIHGADAGMHLAVTLPKGLHDTEISAKAARERLWLRPLSPSYMGDPEQGFVLGFGSTLVEQMPRAVRQMKSILASS